MNNSIKTLAIATVLSTGVMGATGSQAATMDNTKINMLPDQGAAQISGIVTEVDEADEFTVSDDSGEIEVEGLPVANLKEGDRVTVKGVIESSWFDKELKATSVEVNQKSMQVSANTHTDKSHNRDYNARSDYQQDKHYMEGPNSVDMTGKFVDKKGNLRFKDTAAVTEKNRDMFENDPNRGYGERPQNQGRTAH